MPARLADRLNAGRQRRFIGRQAELQMFAEALANHESSFCVLFVHGPGGVGKSSLLGQFVHLCARHEVNACAIDARNIEAYPEAFLAALAMSMGLPAGASPVDAMLGRGGRHVLLIDTYERLAPLDDWLRDVLLPELPAGTIVVTAGRQPPAHAWRIDPGWQPLVRTLALRNLSPDEGRAYLAQRNIPEKERQTVLDFTHSYPLALSLVADLYDQRPNFHFRAEAASDIVKVLVEQLLQRVPGQVHQMALEACALVRVMTESLLAEMTGLENVNELFAWLRNLSFVDARPGGLFPHDLARDALVADLKWRNPDWYAELHRRARAYFMRRVEHGQSMEQQTALFDLVFLHRENPVVRPVFEWQASGRVLPGPMAAQDLPRLLDMVHRHEGAEARRHAEHWLAAQPEAAIVFRDAAGAPAGFALFLNMSALHAAELADDPALAAAATALQKTAPLRPGARVSYFRFWMAAGAYQQVSPIQSLIFINMVRHYLATPGLAYTLIPCADPEFWTPVFAYADLARLPDADFTSDGKHYGVFGHDWRAVPPLQWLELLGEREISMAPQVVQPPVAAERLLVLSQEEFDAAVAAALRGLARPDGLHDSALLRSRLVVQRAGAGSDDAERTAALRQLLLDTIEALHAAPKAIKLYRAIYHTYVQPAPTQEIAAELLDVPFSSYRRHLKSGIEQVAEMLWRREVGG
ncbi:MAG: AAA family ATPase [Caldilineaceae bacterium]|nr:AAA family ATPase [Caldilineaceae bacterium]